MQCGTALSAVDKFSQLTAILRFGTLAANLNSSWRMRLIRTSIKSALIAASAGSMIMIAACGSNNEQDTQAIHPDTAVQQAEIPAAPLSVSEQIEFARQDLAQRQAEDVSAVTLVAARHVTWNSGALGCPGPGANYTQALVPGLLIVLKAGNDQFSYHARSNGIPFYCPKDRIEMPSSIEAEDLA